MALFKKRRKKKIKLKFSKTIVITCISFIVMYTIVQTYLSYTLGIELSPTLTTCVYAFFGTELAALAVVRVFEKEEDKTVKTTTKKTSQPAGDTTTPVG